MSAEQFKIYNYSRRDILILGVISATIFLFVPFIFPKFGWGRLYHYHDYLFFKYNKILVISIIIFFFHLVLPILGILPLIISILKVNIKAIITFQDDKIIISTNDKKQIIINLKDINDINFKANRIQICYNRTNIYQIKSPLFFYPKKGFGKINSELKKRWNNYNLSNDNKTIFRTGAIIFKSRFQIIFVVTLILTVFMSFLLLLSQSRLILDMVAFNKDVLGMGLIIGQIIYLPIIVLILFLISLILKYFFWKEVIFKFDSDILSIKYNGVDDEKLNINEIKSAKIVLPKKLNFLHFFIKINKIHIRFFYFLTISNVEDFTNICKEFVVREGKKQIIREEKNTKTILFK